MVCIANNVEQLFMSKSEVKLYIIQYWMHFRGQITYICFIQFYEWRNKCILCGDFILMSQVVDFYLYMNIKGKINPYINKAEHNDYYYWLSYNCQSPVKFTFQSTEDESIGACLLCQFDLIQSLSRSGLRQVLPWCLPLQSTVIQWGWVKYYPHYSKHLILFETFWYWSWILNNSPPPCILPWCLLVDSWRVSQPMRPLIYFPVVPRLNISVNFPISILYC